MFQSGMSECIDGDIVITQMPYTAFYAVLEYLYCGRLIAGPSDLVDVRRRMRTAASRTWYRGAQA